MDAAYIGAGLDPAQVRAELGTKLSIEDAWAALFGKDYRGQDPRILVRAFALAVLDETFWETDTDFPALRARIEALS